MTDNKEIPQEVKDKAETSFNTLNFLGRTNLKVYTFGFIDGYQQALEEKDKRIRELESELRKPIKITGVIVPNDAPSCM